MTKKLFYATQLGSIGLANRVVMAPMTRSRAIGNIPNDLMATYYGQRASAGLIITEGTAPSPNGLGYSRIPGVYSKEQVAGWRKITQAVHEQGGRIFMQLMHTGRISHPLNMPAGARVLAPSAVAAQGEIWTDQEGLKPNLVPHAMTLVEVDGAIREFVQAAKNAIEAGFDGVELHGANGYLIEQFLNPASNQRTDLYGGSIENRSRFLLETAAQVAAAIGEDRVGVRLSPYSVYNNMPLYNDIPEIYGYLARQLNDIGVVYLHLVDNALPENKPAIGALFGDIRETFTRTLILCGNYNDQTAEAALAANQADLIAFGRPFVANPDLPERLLAGLELATPDSTTFFAGGDKGYADYPAYQPQEA